MFTCTVCETRSLKGMTKEAYEKGVVLARCPGCKNLHLIADNLGYFRKEKINIESILKERGQDIDRITDGVELLPEQIMGKHLYSKFAE